MTEFDIRDMTEQPTAVVKAHVPMAELKGFFDRAYGQVFSTLGRQGVQPAGPPFGYYPRKPDETVDVEAGAPVSAPIEAAGDVVASRLPGGRVVHGVHVGPYEKLAETYGELMAWVAEQGLTLGEGMWESYLSDPVQEPDPATWRTEIFWPLAD